MAKSAAAITFMNGYFSFALNKIGIAFFASRQEIKNPGKGENHSPDKGENYPQNCDI
jgi:hypothetical protein